MLNILNSYRIEVAFCKRQIAGYKCPRSIDCITDPLPLSGVGKVRKDLLREKFGKGKFNTTLDRVLNKLNK